MIIKDKAGKITDRVFNITEEGEKALEELGYTNTKNPKNVRGE